MCSAVSQHSAVGSVSKLCLFYVWLLENIFMGLESHNLILQAAECEIRYRC